LLDLAIEDDRVWIHHDGTEAGVAHEPIALGVPAECLVLGYKSPERRKIVRLV